MPTNELIYNYIFNMMSSTIDTVKIQKISCSLLHIFTWNVRSFQSTPQKLHLLAKGYCYVVKQVHHILKFKSRFIQFFSREAIFWTSYRVWNLPRNFSKSTCQTLQCQSSYYRISISAWGKLFALNYFAYTIFVSRLSATN